MQQTSAAVYGRPSEQPNTASKQLCILSLDGGGVKGLSSLVMLKQVMELIDPEDTPKPCEYFDMIGGTSTGGLIAIMLGRLEMGIDECIAKFKELSLKAFTKIPHQVTLQGKVQGRFDHEAFAQAVRELLKDKHLDEDTLLKDPKHHDGCRTFVCTVSEDVNDTVILPSYYTKRWGTGMLNTARIWETARATSAATSFFDPIEIAGERFVDGATEANNPVNELWTEADNFFRDPSQPDWKLEDNLHCLVSIGTGKPSLKPFGKSVVDIGQTIVSNATNTEKVAERFERQRASLFDKNQAFRFNVSEGLENVGLEEADRLGEITAATRRYIAKQETLVKATVCAEALKERQILARICNEASRIASLHSARPHNEKPLSPATLDYYLHTNAFRSWSQQENNFIWCQTPASAGTSAPLADSLATLLSGERFLRTVIRYAVPRQPPKPKEKPRQFKLIIGSAMESPPRKPKELGPLITMFRGIVSRLLLQCSLRGAICYIKSRQFQQVWTLSTDMRIPQTERLEALLEALYILVAVPTDEKTVIMIDHIDNLVDDSVDEFARMAKRKKLSDHQNRIQFLACGNPEMNLISRLPKDWQINENTEYQECLSSLKFEELNFRRNQISTAAKGTNEWVWKHKSYLAFKRQNSGILWIEGKAGSGKSVLAKSIQTRLSQLRVSTSTTKPAWLNSKFGVGDWFYHARRGAKYIAHQSFIRSVLYHMLEQDDQLFPHFRGFYRAMMDDGAARWDRDDLESILTAICRAGEEAMFILDALDEAQDASIIELLKELVAFPRSRFRFVVLSRSNAKIEMQLHDTHRIRLEEENDGDVSRYIDTRLGELEERMKKPEFQLKDRSDSRTRGTQLRSLQLESRPMSPGLNTPEHQELDKMRKYLKSNAQNTMLWVKLVLDDLQEVLSDSVYTFYSLRQVLLNLPIKLTTYYQDILKRLGCEEHNHKAKLVRRILMWISGAGELQAITLEELWDALAIPEDSSISTEDEDPIRHNRIPATSFDELGRKLADYCGPFIEIFPPPRELGADPSHERHGMSAIQLMHQTVQDFLARPDLAGPLHFHREQAVELVRRESKKYIDLVLPTIPCATSATSNLRSSDAENNGEHTPTIADTVLWLNDRKLLSFVFATSAASKPHILEPFFILFETEAVELVDPATENDQTLYEESPHAHTAAKLFQKACSEGLVGAVLNLTAIAAFFRPWWEHNRERIGMQISQHDNQLGTGFGGHALRIGGPR
ncbi:unnamed protein product [Periconia digitata]|uniref:PNPLA domain-containing protein n=1 Tax=Periconia digitata TaxID=1303443 RepID=A0A9W4UVU2_9PLEO|nr:unnamed protein product [Periconia digitata]